HTPFRTAPVCLAVLVEEILADHVALVVLVDPGPARERVPHDRVEPGVLEGGTAEPGWIPSQRLQRRIDEHPPEPEAAVHDGLPLGFVQRLDSGRHIPGGLRY